MTDQTPNSPEQLIAQILESALHFALQPVMTKLNAIQEDLVNYGDALEALISRIEALEQSNQSAKNSSNQGLLEISRVLSSQYRQMAEFRELVLAVQRTTNPTATLKNSLSKLIAISQRQTQQQTQLSHGLETSVQISTRQMQQHKELSRVLERLTELLESSENP